MAERTAKDTPKKERKRIRLNLSLSAEEAAQLEREVPRGERGRYCKERIFYPWGLRDPLIEVGARLLGRTAQARRLDEVLDELQAKLGSRSLRAPEPADGRDDESLETLSLLLQYAQLNSLIGSVRELVAPLLNDAREILTLIAHKQGEKRAVPFVSERKAD